MRKTIRQLLVLTLIAMSIFLILNLSVPVHAAQSYRYVTQWDGSKWGFGNGDFAYPNYVAVDGSGNVYVTDSENARVEKFSSGGVYIAQWGSYGSGDGQFDHPSGIAVDGSNNVYVVDCYNHRIEKFSSDGFLLGQWGSFGSGVGQFKYPEGIAVDGSGNVYVADNNNNRVEKFSSSGVYLTQWGGVGSAAGKFDIPTGIAVDASNNVYVVDSYNNRVEKFSSIGGFLVQWGSFGYSGNGKFYRPQGIAVDGSNNVYVVDTYNYRVEKFSSDGVYIAQWGSLGSGDGQFNYPKGIAVDGASIYVVDNVNNRVEKFSSDGVFIAKWGNFGGRALFLNPLGVAVDGVDNVYVVDSIYTLNNGVNKFSSEGTSFLGQWGSYGSGDGQFKDPRWIAVDGSGSVYVVDNGNNRVEKFSSDGVFLGQFGSFGSLDAEFNYPEGIAIDATGNIYVADTGNARIQKFSNSGLFLGKWSIYGSGEGGAGPTGIAVDNIGNVYVANFQNDNVQKFSSDGVLLVQWGSYGSGDGQFDGPSGIAVDGNGNVYVVDSNNARIEQFSSDGVFLGQWGSLGSGDGQFDKPWGVAVDHSDYVYVVDNGNKRVEVFQTTQNGYSLTVSTVGSGSVVKNPSQASYHLGDVVVLTATPVAGWSFAGWSGDFASLVNPVSITVNGATSVTATFTQNKYTVNINKIGLGGVLWIGSWDPNNWYNSSFTCHYGDNVVFLATPQTGWSFSGWSGDVSGTNPLTSALIIDGDKSVTATFTPIEYALAINIVGGGSVTKNPDKDTYHLSEVVTLTANPNPGYTFAGWSGDLTGTLISDSLVIDYNPAVTATFQPIPIVAVTIASNPLLAGWFYADGVQTAYPATLNWAVGSQHTINSASSLSGVTGTQYIWTGWSDGEGISHTITVPSSATTITANYQLQYQISASYSSSDGSVPSSSINLHGVSLGSAISVTLTTTEQTCWLDAGTRWDVTALISPGMEQWKAMATEISGMVTGSKTIAPIYYHQFFVPVGFSTLDGSFPTSTVTLRSKSLGSDYSVPLNSAGQREWLDAGTTWNINSVMPTSPTTERWIAIAGFTGTVNSLTSVSPLYYHQFSVTAQYSTQDAVPVSPEDVHLSGIFQNSPSSVMVRTYAQVWFDSGSTWRISSQVPVSPTNERWVTPDPTSGTVSSSLMLSLTYYHQFKMTLSYSVNGGGSSYSAPLFTEKQLGSTATQRLSTTATGYWFDATYDTLVWQVTNPLSGSSSTERWFSTQPVTGTIAASGTLNFLYNHQYQVSFATSPSTSGTTSPSGSNFYNYGVTIPISVVANAGFSFASWSTNSPSVTIANSNLAATTATINGYVTITASFAANNQIGIIVKNSPIAAPPSSPWTCEIFDLTKGTEVGTFVLSANGGDQSVFSSLGVTGGHFLVNQTQKFGYVTSMKVNGQAVEGSQIIINLAAGDLAEVDFINTAMPAFATQFLGQPPPSDLNIQFPALKPVPVQSAWSVDINNDGKVDLVLGKPMAILVNLAGVALVSTDQITVSVTFEGTTYSKTFSASSLGVGAVVGFSPIVPNVAGNKEITGSYQINSPNLVTLTPTSVTVKTTNSLSLYYACLSKSTYGSESQTAFDLMAQNSVAFLNATYPIKNVTANIVFAGKSIAGSTKTGTTAMQADCVAVAAKAKSVMGTGAIGVAIAPNNTNLKDYFASLGKPGAAGVSFGPSTKGVIVLDGYYTAAAHEVAHTYGLYWGVPEQYQTNPQNGKASSGVWPANGQWRTGYSFMGTAPYKTSDFSWVDDGSTYRYMFNHTVTNLADPEIVVVSGLIYKTGAIEFVSDWYHLNQGIPDTVPAGNYVLKFLDANGKTLLTTSFDAQFFMHIDPGVSVGADQIDTSAFGKVDTDAASFAFATQYPSGTASIQIIDATKPGVPLATVKASTLVQVGNNVTFTENGLPAGTAWSVTLSGVTMSSTTNSIIFSGISSGSYSWNASTTVSGGIGTRYTAVSSLGSVTVSGQTSQIVAFNKQYYLAMSTIFGDVAPDSGWFDAGAKVTISAVSPTTVSGERYQWLGWLGVGSGSYTGTGNPASNVVTMNGPIWEVAGWNHQYLLTVKTNVVSSSYSVDVSLGGDAAGHASDASAFTTWVIAGFPTGKVGVSDHVSGTGNTQYAFSSWNGGSSSNPQASFMMNGPTTLIANYKTQYKVTFSQSGVGSTFKGTVAKVDGVNYALSGLPVSFWWDKGSAHSFQFLSPLTVNKVSYLWSTSSGLSAAQSGTIIVSGAGSVNGKYVQR